MDSFYGLQPRWVTADRFYRVFVSDRMLALAYVAGQIHDEQIASHMAAQGQILAPLFWAFFRRRLAKAELRKASYDTIDPTSPEFLDSDPRNFLIPRSDIVRIRLHRKRSLWTPFNVGSVGLELADGSSRRFILAGDQDVEDVVRLLAEFDPRLEIDGVSWPLPRPKSMTPAQARRLMVLFSVFSLAIAAVFGYVGLARRPDKLPLAAMNLVVGLWALVLALRGPKDRPSTDSPTSCGASEEPNGA